MFLLLFSLPGCLSDSPLSLVVSDWIPPPQTKFDAKDTCREGGREIGESQDLPGSRAHAHELQPLGVQDQVTQENDPKSTADPVSRSPWDL